MHAQAWTVKVLGLFAAPGRALIFRGGIGVVDRAGFIRGIWIALILCASLQNWCAQAANVTLAWNPSPSGGVSGYRVYMGNRSGSYTNILSAGNSTSITVSNLQVDTTYFFAITAFDAIGRESEFSNEISYTPTVVVFLPRIASLQMKVAATGGMTLAVTGTAGRTYDLLASTDLKNWAVIRVFTLGASGQLNFTDPDAAKYPARFYRTRETQLSVSLRATTARQMVVLVTGQNGRTYDVLASSNLRDWAVIGAATVGESGTVEFTDAGAANYSSRFYRTRERLL